MQYALQPDKTKRGRSKHDCTLVPWLLSYIKEQCLTEIYLGHKLFDQTFFLSTTAHLSSMRWHVTALAAVWLIVMGWCGSVVMGQPVGGFQHQAHHPQVGQSIPEMWALLDPADGSADTYKDGNNLHGDLYYFPAIPIMKRQQNLEDDSGWQSQDRSKRQSQSNSGSSGNHHSQLSIISPIEALRSRLRLEMLRRQYGNQIKQNQDKLERVGKRRKRSNLVDSADGSDEEWMSQSAVLASAIKAP